MDNFFYKILSDTLLGKNIPRIFDLKAVRETKNVQIPKKKKKKPIWSPQGHVKIPCVALPGSIGNLSNDDGDVKENVNNAIGLDWQNHPFLYISLPSLHDYNVKVPIFTFCRGREHQTTTFLFFS